MSSMASKLPPRLEPAAAAASRAASAALIKYSPSVHIPLVFRFQGGLGEALSLGNPVWVPQSQLAPGQLKALRQ